jgi:sugar lactone lactonase YvrE
MTGTIEYHVLVEGGPGRLGESSLWCPRTRRFWWVDIVAPKLHAFDPADGTYTTYNLPGTSLGCCILRAAGGFVLALDQTLHSFDPQQGTLAPLVTPEGGRPLNRLNDGKADRRGRIWIGTMNRQVYDPDGSLYRVGSDLSVDHQFDDVVIPNSIAFSPDDRVFYFSDTRRATIWAFDFDLDLGRIFNRRIFSDTRNHPGRPDGSTVDAEGFLWNAEVMGGRLVRYAPDGRIDRVIGLPVPRPTSCGFGGDRLDTLYVTSMSAGLSEEQFAQAPLSGGLIAIDAGVRGLPEPFFLG